MSQSRTPLHYSEIAHDLRTPLASITLVVDYANMSDNAHVQKAGEDCTTALEAIHSNARRLDPNLCPAPSTEPDATQHYVQVTQALRQDLLSISNTFRAIAHVQHPDSEVMTTKLAECLTTASEIVDLADPLWQYDTAATPLSIETEVQRAIHQRTAPDSQPPLEMLHSVTGDFQVRASRTAANRLLGNLISNAISAVRKSKKEQGYVSVAVRATSPTSGQVVVEDNGIGIAAEDLSRIWDQSFTTSEGHGHGLGMGIIRDMAARMGATIAVESTLNVGTRFTLTFADLV